MKNLLFVLLLSVVLLGCENEKETTVLESVKTVNGVDVKINNGSASLLVDDAVKVDEEVEVDIDSIGNVKVDEEVEVDLDSIGNVKIGEDGISLDSLGVEVGF